MSLSKSVTAFNSGAEFEDETEMEKQYNNGKISSDNLEEQTPLHSLLHPFL